MIYNQYITISVYYPSELFQKSSLSALYLLLFPYFKPGLLQPSSNWSPCDSFLSTLVHFPWCLCDPLKSLVISLSHIKKFGGDLLNRPGGPHSSFSSLYFYLWPSLDILLCILSTPVLQSSLYSVHNAFSFFGLFFVFVYISVTPSRIFSSLLTVANFFQFYIPRF